MTRIGTITLVALLLLAPLAHAADDAAAGVAWSGLSPQQQQTLGGFAQGWDKLPPARQQASPEQRDSARGRFQTWQQMPEQRRELIRNRVEQFRALTPEQQAAVRENFHSFRQLPPEQRQMLRQQWRNATDRKSVV